MNYDDYKRARDLSWRVAEHRHAGAAGEGLADLQEVRRDVAELPGRSAADPGVGP